MGRTRKVGQVWTSRPTLEGAGVHLRRAFGYPEVPRFDPFLLLDDFRSKKPEEYLAGFPWHPHRGIETISYVLRGSVEHGDSMGNRGVIGAGDVQWMTAGRGVIHQEMPKGDGNGAMEGFQLWANLPARQKMMPPRYREVKGRDIPEVAVDGGASLRVISGRAGGVEGPVRDIVIEPEVLDVTLPAGSTFSHRTKRGHTVVAYGIEGNGRFGGGNQGIGNGTLVLFEDGDSVEARAGDEPFRFLLVSGRPLGEPIAWHGPIVMNTQEELETAFEEYRQGTFIR
jgi:hypothetical protein